MFLFVANHPQPCRRNFGLMPLQLSQPQAAEHSVTGAQEGERHGAMRPELK
jgi:hypothetical protein